MAIDKIFRSSWAFCLLFVEHGFDLLSESCSPAQAEVKFQQVGQYSSGKGTPRGLRTISTGVTVWPSRAYFPWVDHIGDNPFISMSSGHLISGLELSFNGDIDNDFS